MTKKPEEHDNGGRDSPDTRPRRIRKSVRDDAEIVVRIEHTKPGTALDDHLRREQTRAVIDLVADIKRKQDEGNDDPTTHPS